MEYGYYLEGTHSEENTTEIVTTSLFGTGLECMWLGGGTYVMNNQSNAQARLNGNSVAMLDDTAPDIAIFGSSKIFMNKNLVKCNNSLLLDNLNQYLLRNTLTATTSLSENTTLYETGRSVYVNLELEDYYGNPVDDLFVAIAYELPNGSLAFFIAGFVEEGLYSSQFTPSYWRSEGRINGIFIVLGDENYAMTYASISFYLYVNPPPTQPTIPQVGLSMAQIALITSVGIFGGVIGFLVYNRRRMKRRLRIPEIRPELVREIDNTLSNLLAAFTQLDGQAQRTPSLASEAYWEKVAAFGAILLCEQERIPWCNRSQRSWKDHSASRSHWTNRSYCWSGFRWRLRCHKEVQADQPSRRICPAARTPQFVL
jgi:hypothetical protein